VIERRDPLKFGGRRWVTRGASRGEEGSLSEPLSILELKR